MMPPPADLSRLLVVTDRAQLPPGRDLVWVVARCVAAGARTVVLRELDLTTQRRALLARELSDVGARVIAAHDALPGCVGVQVPAGAVAGTGSWGRSCHSAFAVDAAAAEGARWATLSPFAATSSKPGYGPPVERAAYADHPIGVYALGGVTPRNAAGAIAAGAYGVAVMGAVMRAQDPASVVARLLAVIP